MSFNNLKNLIEASKEVSNYKKAVEFVNSFEMVSNESVLNLKNKEASVCNLNNFKAAVKQFLKIGSNEIKELISHAFGESMERLEVVENLTDLSSAMRASLKRHNPRVVTELEILLSRTKLNPFDVNFRSEWLLYQERMRDRDEISGSPWDDATKMSRVGNATSNEVLFAIACSAASRTDNLTFEFLKKSFDFMSKIKFRNEGSSHSVESAKFLERKEVVSAKPPFKPKGKAFPAAKVNLAKGKGKESEKTHKESPRCNWCNATHKYYDCPHKKANRTCHKCGGNHLASICKRETANVAEFAFMSDYVPIQPDTPIYTHANENDVEFEYQELDGYEYDEDKLVDMSCYSNKSGNSKRKGIVKPCSSHSRFKSKRVKAAEGGFLSSQNEVVFLVDSGCSYPIIGKLASQYATNVISSEKHFNTANGTMITQKIGTISGRTKLVNGEYAPISITGALTDKLEMCLLPAKEAFFSSESSPWVVVDNLKYQSKMMGNNFYLTLEVVRNSAFSAAIEDKKKTESERRNATKIVLERWGYLSVGPFGERIQGGTLENELKTAIRHLHCRLNHCSADSLHATIVEQNVDWISQKSVSDIIAGCKWCLLKKTHVKKFFPVENRGINSKDVEKVKENAQVVSSKDMKESTPTFPQSSYEGVGYFPGHAIMQDVSYLPDGVGGSKGFSLIIDVKTRFIMGGTVSHKKDSKSPKLTQETTQLLTQWCSARGRPSIVKTDNGSEFLGVYSQFNLENGIDHQFGAPYTPQQQGLVERANGTIKKLMALLLLKFNWPVDHWTLVLKSAIEIYNTTASGTYKVSPIKAWYGIAPTLRLIPGDRVVVNVKENPALGGEDLDKFNLKTMFCTYLHRESRIVQVAVMTKSSEVSTAYVPMRQIGTSWKHMYDVAKEACQIFQEPRSVDKTMNLINNQETYNRWKLESYDWDPLRDDGEVEFVHESRSKIDLTEQLVIRVEEAIRQGDDAAIDRTLPSNKPKPKIGVRRKGIPNDPDRVVSHLSFIVKNAVESLKTIEGKTHNEVSSEEVASGTHNVAMNSELQQFVKNKVFVKELTAKEAKDQSIKVIGTRWVHSWKVKGANRVAKSRLVARGFLDKANVPVYVDVPTGKFRRVALIIGLMLKKKAYVADVKTAFLQAPIEKDRHIAVKLPSVIPKNNPLNREAGSIMLLGKAMYGLQDSPRVFCKWLQTQLESFGWRCIGWGMFIRTSKNNIDFDVIVSYIDDLWIWCDEVDKIYKELQSKVSIDELQEISDEWTRYIGVEVKFNSEHSQMVTSIAKYCEGISIPEGIKGFVRDSDFPIVEACDEEIDLSLVHEMQSIVGKIGYVGMNHPGLSYIYGELSRHTHKPSKKLLDLAYRVASCIKCQTPADLPYSRVEKGKGELRVWTDASLRRQGLSGIGRSGYIIQYVEAKEDLTFRGNYIHWGSVVDKRKHPSTSSAEISAMILGLREAVDIARCIHKLTGTSASMKVLIDAKVVEEQLKIEKAKTNPFDQENVDYALQCLNDMTKYGISEATVVHVDTKTQKADGLTKFIRGIWVDLSAFMVHLTK